MTIVAKRNIPSDAETIGAIDIGKLISAIDELQEVFELGTKALDDSNSAEFAALSERRDAAAAKYREEVLKVNGIAAEMRKNNKSAQLLSPQAKKMLDQKKSTLFVTLDDGLKRINRTSRGVGKVQEILVKCLVRETTKNNGAVNYSRDGKTKDIQQGRTSAVLSESV